MKNIDAIIKEARALAVAAQEAEKVAAHTWSKWVEVAKQADVHRLEARKARDEAHDAWKRVADHARERGGL